MHSNKSSVLLLALAISASCVVATPHLQFLDGIFDSIPQTGHHIISGFVNATRNGTAIAGEFLDSIRNSSAQYTHETIEFAHKIADAVHRAASEAIVDFSVTLQASIDIVHQHVGLVRNILQQKALKDALATLQTVTAVVNDLEVAVHNLNDQLDEKKQEYSAIIQVKWSLWTDDQLNRVDELTNGVGNEEAEEIMNELVSRYSGYLHSCLEELQAQQATYEQNVQEAIVKYHNATNKLTAQVKLCAQFNPNYLSCRNGINTELRALDSAPAELLTLKLQGIRLLAIGLNANGCVGQTLADHELEKASVELKLDEIIRQYQEQQDGETTTIS